jgi:hypothetical protein
MHGVRSAVRTHPLQWHVVLAYTFAWLLLVPAMLGAPPRPAADRAGALSSRLHPGGRRSSRGMAHRRRGAQGDDGSRVAVRTAVETWAAVDPVIDNVVIDGDFVTGARGTTVTARHEPIAWLVDEVRDESWQGSTSPPRVRSSQLSGHSSRLEPASVC